MEDAGNSCLSITGASERSVGFVEQSSQLSHGAGPRIIDLSGRIRSIAVSGKGAGLNMGVYDSVGVLLANVDMGYSSLSWLQGTTKWKQYHVRLVAPAEAASVKVGAILYGKGEARFDDYKIEISPLSGRTASKIAGRCINAAMDTVAVHSLMRDSVDLSSLRKTALQIAGNAKVYSDCDLAVAYMLAALGDHHSFLMTSQEVKRWESDTSAESNIKFASAKIVDGCGYVLVPPFHGGNPKLMQAYCDTLQAVIANLEAQNVVGWIVDLRENTGGNMAPMIAGLGPLFDTGVLGYLIDVKGIREGWSYSYGVYRWQGSEVLKATKPVVLSRKPIAVLTGNQTGSSGECLAISFIGNSNTRSFGLPTWGLTTGNGSFDLPGGSRMMLASTVMAARSGHPFHGPIAPDEVVQQGSSKTEDEQLLKAITWIKKLADR